MDADPEVARQRGRQVVRGDDERRHRERLGVDAERELGHRHVADDDDLVDVVRRDARLLADLAGELGERLVRARLERAERVLVEHRGRHARDDVGAVGLLAVEHRAHGGGRAGLEVEQRGDHRGGAEVEGDREPARRGVAGLDADQQVVDHHGGDVEVRVAQHLAERLDHRELHPRLEVVERVEHALHVRALVLERRLLEHEMALHHRRPQDHVAADADQRRLRPRLQRRHVDHQVGARLRAAGEPPALAQLVGARTRAGRPSRPARRRRRTRTLHFLHVPWPPHVESIAIPFQLAASKIDVPAGTRTPVPSGSKRRWTRSGPSATTSLPPPAVLCGLRSNWTPRGRGRAAGQPPGRSRRTPRPCS